MYQPRYITYIPTKVHTNQKGKAWFDDQCRRAFDLKQEVHLRWTCDHSRVNRKDLVDFQVRANETYSEANVSLMWETDILMNVLSCHKYKSTLKTVVFGTGSSLPPLVGGGGDLVCEYVVRLICCQIILTASSAGSQLICCSLDIHLQVSSP